MNDEQIIQKGGDEGDIEAYANQNGANLTKFDVEIDEKIQEQQFMTRRNSELVVVNDEPMLAYDGLKLDEQVAANMLVAYNHAQQNLYQQLQKDRQAISTLLCEPLEGEIKELDAMEALGIATEFNLGEKIGLGKAKAIIRQTLEGKQE